MSPQFNYADRFVGDRALVIVKDQYGFIDRTGKVIVPLQYRLPQALDFYGSIARYRFSRGFAVFTDAGRCGYIDRFGKTIVKPQYQNCHPFDAQGIAQVETGFDLKTAVYQSSYINSTGRVIFNGVANSAQAIYPLRVRLLVSVLILGCWILAISVHEFGHAIVAYWGGDNSVKAKGYLSFNPLRYINPIHSLIVPASYLPSVDFILCRRLHRTAKH